MPTPAILAVHLTFFRHDRRYCVFSVIGREDEFLFYSHEIRPLRSLMFGKDFLGRLPRLMENEALCIECGLGLSVRGGIALDNGNLVASHCTVGEANRLLAGLRETLGDRGQWIEFF